MSGRWRTGVEYDPMEQSFERSVLEYAESKRGGGSKRVSKRISSATKPRHGEQEGKEGVYKGRYMIYGNIESYDLRSPPPPTAPTVASSESHTRTQDAPQHHFDGSAHSRHASRGRRGGDSNRKSLRGLALLSTPEHTVQPETHTRPNFPTSPNYRAYDPRAERGADSYTAKFLRFGRRDRGSAHRQPSFEPASGRSHPSENMLSQLSYRSSPPMSSRLRQTNNSNDLHGANANGFDEFEHGSLKAVDDIVSSNHLEEKDGGSNGVNMSISDFLEKLSTEEEETGKYNAENENDGDTHESESVSSSQLMEEYKEQHEKANNLEGLLDSIRQKLEHSKKLQTAISHIQKSKRRNELQSNDQDSVSSWMASVEKQQLHDEDDGSQRGAVAVPSSDDEEQSVGLSKEETEVNGQVQGKSEETASAHSNLNGIDETDSLVTGSFSDQIVNRESTTSSSRTHDLENIVDDLTEFSVKLQVRSSSLRETIDNLCRNGFYGNNTEFGCMGQIEGEAPHVREEQEWQVSVQGNIDSSASSPGEDRQRRRRPFTHSSLHERARNFAQRRKQYRMVGIKSSYVENSHDKESTTEATDTSTVSIPAGEGNVHNKVEAVSPVSHDHPEWLLPTHFSKTRNDLESTSATSAAVNGASETSNASMARYEGPCCDSQISPGGDGRSALSSDSFLKLTGNETSSPSGQFTWDTEPWCRRHQQEAVGPSGTSYELEKAREHPVATSTMSAIVGEPSSADRVFLNSRDMPSAVSTGTTDLGTGRAMDSPTANTASATERTTGVVQETSHFDAYEVHTMGTGEAAIPLTLSSSPPMATAEERTTAIAATGNHTEISAAKEATSSPNNDENDPLISFLKGIS
eukprot:gb/GECG01003587.1/.p1 GENE.gb/GECG01003587.1/~~gb/GECG01003587.1/.p1  ORF type:complete len:862 (+),score=142.91 gb/GECG01003587.1/:1-2586(+)